MKAFLCVALVADTYLHQINFWNKILTIAETTNITMFAMT